MHDINPVVKRTLTTPTTRRLVTSNEEQNKRTLITSASDGDIKNGDPNAGNGTLLTSASDGDIKNGDPNAGNGTLLTSASDGI